MIQPDPANPTLVQPLRAQTSTGAIRRVGVELEFTGLSIEQISACIQHAFGGRIEPLSAYEFDVRGTWHGDFKVELDYTYLKQRSRNNNVEGFWDQVARLSEDLLGAIASRLVPLEVVAPPIAMNRLHALHPLIADLRAAGATGTHASAFYAFGLHFNPEVPDTKAETLLAYMRAFSVAFDWLQRVSGIDLSRRIFPYIQPYDRRYVRRICDPDYAPTATELMDDYLASNASRNRALDMLPIFAWLDRERVMASIEDYRVKARPTLHYRLPNCEIEQPHWDLRPSWGHWRVVEDLAADHDRLIDLCADYCRALDMSNGDACSRWLEHFERHLQKNSMLERPRPGL